MAHARAGIEALAAITHTVNEPIGFDQAPSLLLSRSRTDLVMIEAVGINPDVLGATIDAAATLNETRQVPIIVVLTRDQIEEVAVRLLAGRVQLLCDPTPAERAAAVAMALATPARSGVREESEDAGHLRRLHEEVARIADLLTRLSSGDTSPKRRDMLGDRTIGYRAESNSQVSVTAAEVRHLIRMRRLRDQFFDAGMFEDPAWDMLLDLFAAELEQSRVSVSSLCIAAAVAPTTALRWIGRMTEAGLFDRVPDPADRRRAFMVLAPKALEAMHGYWAAVKRAGGSIS